MLNNKDIIAQEFIDDAWLAFHDGDINEMPDFHRFLGEWVQSKATYTDDCREFVGIMGDEYIFGEHEIWGRPDGWEQAGYNALHDLLQENSDVAKLWDEMEEVIVKKTMTLEERVELLEETVKNLLNE